MGIEVLLGAAFAVATVALLLILRRERLRRRVSDTHPVLIGVYRGCAVVIVAFIALVVLGATFNALYRPPLLP